MGALEKSCFVVIALLVMLIGWVIFDNATAEKFSLRKDKWHCTATRTQLQMIGKAAMPVQVCSQWTEHE